MLWDRSVGDLRTEAAIGPFAEVEKKMECRIGQGIPGRVMETGVPVWTSDRQSDGRLRDNPFAFKTFVCFPLQTIKGDPLGVANAWFLQEEKTISNYEIDIASTYLTRATLAIENALLHRKEREADKEEGDRQEKAA